MRDLPHNTQLIGDVFLPNTSIADRISHGHEDMTGSASPAGAMSAWRRAPIRNAVSPAWRRCWIAIVTPELQKVRHHRHAAAKVYIIHLTPFTQVHLTLVAAGGST